MQIILCQFWVFTSLTARHVLFLVFQDAWPEPVVPIGRVSQYSSLRKHRPGEYRIQDASFSSKYNFSLVISSFPIKP